jgi:aromatic ring-opening dioxygenase catalytic subunit (LigB family)
MEIVGAYACSHAGLIVARRALAPADQRERVFAAYDAVRDEIARLRPDALVVVGTDHMQAFPLSHVATFAVGVGPVAKGLGDGGLPACTVPVHQALAQAILYGGVQRGVDLAFSEAVAIDHSFVMPLSLLVPGLDVPIVPVTQNCNVPPRPTLGRSRELGRSIRESIREGPRGRAVVVGTGGLSHWVGSATRRAFMNRAAGTRLAQLAEHPVVLEATGEINQEFDRQFLDQVAAGRLGDFAATWTPERLEKVAGNGAQELRNWITTAAIAGDARARVLAYEPVAEWLTGTAVVRFAL